VCVVVGHLLITPMSLGGWCSGSPALIQHRNGETHAPLSRCRVGWGRRASERLGREVARGGEKEWSGSLGSNL
jgi:hypothetical protein